MNKFLKSATIESLRSGTIRGCRYDHFDSQDSFIPITLFSVLSFIAILIAL